MVQIIDHRPDFIPEGDIVYFTVSKSRTDDHAAEAEWRCSAHAGPVVGGRVGVASGIKEASAAFMEAVAYAREHHIEYMVIRDPGRLFPPERRFQTSSVRTPNIGAESAPDLDADTQGTEALPSPEIAREVHLRSLAARQGLCLGTSRGRGPHASSDRRYVLFADPSRAVAALDVVAERRSPADVDGIGYQGTLEEIEAFLVRAEQADTVPTRTAASGSP